MKTYGPYAIGHDNVPCKSIGRISRAIGPPSLKSIFPRRFLHRGLVAYKTRNAVINCVCEKQLQTVKRNAKSFHDDFPPSKQEHQKRAITGRTYLTDTLLSLLRYVLAIAIVFYQTIVKDCLAVFFKYRPTFTKTWSKRGFIIGVLLTD